MEKAFVYKKLLYFCRKKFDEMMLNPVVLLFFVILLSFSLS